MEKEPLLKHEKHGQSNICKYIAIAVIYIIILSGLVVGTIFIFYTVPKFHDPSTNANLREFTITNISFDWFINFENKSIHGAANLTIKCIKTGFTNITLDTKNLTIFRILNEKNESQKWELEDIKNTTFAWMGQKLVIFLDSDSIANRNYYILIYYSTTQNPYALHWIEKDQTKAKKLPFVYAQCEPIASRSLFPNMDTPYNKFSWEAVIRIKRSDPNYNFSAYMSANLTSVEHTAEQMTYYFKSEIDYPSQLFAFAVGQLEKIKIQDSDRCFIIAENTTEIQSYAKELSSLESQLKSAEKMLQTYEWGNYSILVLSPNYPQGGMENPLLTFISETIFVGDGRQSLNVIHEIVHSWVGNLLTCKKWEDLWITEGITTFITRRIIEEYEKNKDPEIWNIMSQEGNNSLWSQMKEKNSTNETSLNRLVLNLTNKDPEECIGTVQREKGFQLMIQLESLFEKKEDLMTVLRKITKDQSPLKEEEKEEDQTDYRKKSIESSDFQELFIKLAKKQIKNVEQIKWDDWFYSEAPPHLTQTFGSESIKKAQILEENIIEKEFPPDYIKEYNEFTQNVANIFWQDLISKESKISNSSMEKLEVLNLATSNDQILASKWFALCAARNYTKDDNQMEIFLEKNGRIALISPIYTNLAKNRKEQAIVIFGKYKEKYHQIVQTKIRKILGIK